MLYFTVYEILNNSVTLIVSQDQERFTSPWARNITDEEKFEHVTSILGALLREDLKLQALYHMLVMFTPSLLAPSHVQVQLYNVFFYILHSKYRK